MPRAVYLLRHAHTTPTRDHAPDFDWPLDAVGEAQARRLVPLLRGLQLDSIYSSPQRRAAQTVAPLALTLGLTARTRDDLRESAFNRGWSDDFVALVREHWRDPDYHRPGCESHRSCRRRFVSALRELAVEHAGNTLVCSGGQAIGLTLHALGTPFGFDEWARIRTPDLFRLVVQDGELRHDRSFRFEGVPD